MKELKIGRDLLKVTQIDGDVCGILYLTCLSPLPRFSLPEHSRRACESNIRWRSWLNHYIRARCSEYLNQRYGSREAKMGEENRGSEC